MLIIIVFTESGPEEPKTDTAKRTSVDKVVQVKMRKIESDMEVISELTALKDKIVIDVGCGTGALVRDLTARGARVTGIDIPEMLEKAQKVTPVGNEKYMAGKGESLPFENNYADIILYIASLHHVSPAKINTAVEEVHRVLKPGGTIVFLEPVPRKGAYYEITRLVDDEKEILTLAYRAIKDAAPSRLKLKEESFVYFERSFENYVQILQTFVSDEEKRNRALAEAKKVTQRLSRKAGVAFNDFRYKSICRVNVLQKPVEA